MFRFLQFLASDEVLFHPKTQPAVDGHARRQAHAEPTTRTEDRNYIDAEHTFAVTCQLRIIVYYLPRILTASLCMMESLERFLFWLVCVPVVLYDVMALLITR